MSLMDRPNQTRLVHHNKPRCKIYIATGIQIHSIIDKQNSFDVSNANWPLSTKRLSNIPARGARATFKSPFSSSGVQWIKSSDDAKYKLVSPKYIQNLPLIFVAMNLSPSRLATICPDLLHRFLYLPCSTVPLLVPMMQIGWCGQAQSCRGAIIAGVCENVLALCIFNQPRIFHTAFPFKYFHGVVRGKEYGFRLLVKWSPSLLTANPNRDVPL